MYARRGGHAPAFLVLALLAGAGCGGEEPSGSDASARPPEIRITAAMNGASTALKVGHVLRIELPARPATGSVWEVESVDEAVLRVPVEEYRPADADDAPGTSIWRFEAIGIGRTVVTLRYVRFGADQPTVEKTFTFKVLVD